ncbi:glyoxalase/bleomycin resistance/dioxygenase family protein [Aeromonas diversa]|uniref:glyoxalase/bleomycin resistance/dioxygenase family protein n=1 Tax=Aeromonas diversa TaxID=502790 RepID=UPI0039A09063
MTKAARAGALIYVSDLGKQLHFYRTLLGMDVLHQDAEYAVLDHADAQLVLHVIPPAYADNVALTTPPTLREQCAIKLFFSVPSLARAEIMADDLGGGVLAQQWRGPGFVVRNAFDPEGNVLQLRQWLDDAPL